jgi:hypothetical protein
VRKDEDELLEIDGQARRFSQGCVFRRKLLVAAGLNTAEALAGYGERRLLAATELWFRMANVGATRLAPVQLRDSNA